MSRSKMISSGEIKGQMASDQFKPGALKSRGNFILQESPLFGGSVITAQVGL